MLWVPKYNPKKFKNVVYTTSEYSIASVFLGAENKYVITSRYKKLKADKKMQ